MTGRNENGLIEVVKTLRNRQFSFPPEAWGHWLPKAVAVILGGLEGQRRPTHGDKRLMGYEVGEANRAVPVGGSAYGIPRNLYMLEETLMPVMGPAKVIIVTVPPDDAGWAWACGRAWEEKTLQRRTKRLRNNNRCMVVRIEM